MLLGLWEEIAMNSEQRTNIKQPMVMKTKIIYSLIPLDDFKAIMGIDDREDKIARFCLVTSTFTIEQYCKRRLRISADLNTQNETLEQKLQNT